MKTIGLDRPVYILPFDHRGSFETRMFGWHGDLNASHTAEIAAAKQVTYNGFKAAKGAGVPQEKAGILVDEQFGGAVLRDARTHGYHTACPVKGDRKTYDLELRPKLMVATLHQLQDAGVEQDVCKIEGLERSEDCEKIVATAQSGGRDKVGCIILGRGAEDEKVHEWLATAARVKGFIGFAVGRTDFWDALVNYRAGKITRDDAVARIALRYENFVDIFEKARPS